MVPEGFGEAQMTIWNDIINTINKNKYYLL